MSRSGFTLVELVIVAAVISILVALSIPVGTWAMMASREAGAIGALRTISTSQEAFRSTGMRDDNGDGAGDYGTLDELGAPPDSATQPYIDAALASGTRQGYTYMVEVIPGDAFTNPAFAARAIPIVHGRSGRRNFYVDEEGVLRFTVGLEGVDPLGPDSPEVE